jgi:hypothetical protein
MLRPHFDQWLSVEVPQKPGLAPVSYVGASALPDTFTLALPDKGDGFGYHRYIYLLQGGGFIPGYGVLQPMLPRGTLLAFWPPGANVYGHTGKQHWKFVPVALVPSWLLALC